MGEEKLDKLLSGDLSKIEPIVKEMSDSDKQQYLDEIIPKLKDKGPDVRWKAAMALGRIGDNRAVEPLTSALSDKDRNVSNEVEKALGNIGAPAVEPLKGALDAYVGSDYAYVRANIIRTLGRIGSRWDMSSIIIKDIVNTLKEVSNKDVNQSNRTIAEVELDNIKAKHIRTTLKRIFGFEEVAEEKYKKSPLNEEAVIKDLASLKADMNWVKRFMWLIITTLIGGVLSRLLM